MATGIVPAIGRPGIGSAVTAQRLGVSRGGELGYFPGGGTIEGSLTRDPGNSASSVFSIRPGTLMGLITASNYYAPSIMGATSGAYTSGGTSLTVSAASAAYLVARVGASGTFTLKGAATAGGTLTTDTVTFSAVNTTTGAITITDIGANRIAGSLVTATDGSGTPITFVPDGYNILIPDDLSDVPFPRIPVSGIVDVGQLINWPSDTTLRTWIRSSLSTAAGGKFVFNDQFAAS